VIARDQDDLASIAPGKTLGEAGKQVQGDRVLLLNFTIRVCAAGRSTLHEVATDYDGFGGWDCWLLGDVAVAVGDER
jgi:hypothetical protein